MLRRSVARPCCPIVTSSRCVPRVRLVLPRRSFASPASPASPADILYSDHRRVCDLLDRIKTSRPSDSSDVEIQNQRKAWAREVITEVSAHSVVEEQVVYPLLRTMGNDADNKVDHSIEEHKEVATIMLDLENTSDMAEFDRLTEKLQSSLTHHIKEEEMTLLPRLARLTPEQQLDLTTLMETARKLAPSHPHPFAPHTPPANILLGPVTTLIDSVKDAMGMRKPLDQKVESTKNV